LPLSLSSFKLFCEQIDKAGKLGLDIVCLGEAITLVGTGCSVKECAEPIPGPSTRQLGDAARKNNIWVVAGLTERDGDIIYNTAVLLDRQGHLEGKYRTISPESEKFSHNFWDNYG
jgi:predicted amidohydrolase